MVRAMLTLVAFGGVAASEENITTTTTIIDGPPVPPDGLCPFKTQQRFKAHGNTFTTCNHVCDQVGLPFLHNWRKGHESLDFTMGATGAGMTNVQKAELLFSSATKKTCYGCPTIVDDVCTKNGGTQCFTQAQITALSLGTASATKHPHGCIYAGSGELADALANTCAYEGIFEGKSVMEMLIDEDVLKLPEESCKYSYIHNSGAPLFELIDGMMELASDAQIEV